MDRDVNRSRTFGSPSLGHRSPPGRHRLRYRESLERSERAMWLSPAPDAYPPLPEDAMRRVRNATNTFDTIKHTSSATPRIASFEFGGSGKLDPFDSPRELWSSFSPPRSVRRRPPTPGEPRRLSGNSQDARRLANGSPPPMLPDLGSPSPDVPPLPPDAKHNVDMARKRSVGIPLEHNSEMSEACSEEFDDDFFRYSPPPRAPTPGSFVRRTPSSTLSYTLSGPSDSSPRAISPLDEPSSQMRRSGSTVTIVRQTPEEVPPPLPDGAKAAAESKPFSPPLHRPPSLADWTSAFDTLDLYEPNVPNLDLYMDEKTNPAPSDLPREEHTLASEDVEPPRETHNEGKAHGREFSPESKNRPSQRNRLARELAQAKDYMAKLSSPIRQREDAEPPVLTDNRNDSFESHGTVHILDEVPSTPERRASVSNESQDAFEIPLRTPPRVQQPVPSQVRVLSRRLDTSFSEQQGHSPTASFTSRASAVPRVVALSSRSPESSLPASPFWSATRSHLPAEQQRDSLLDLSENWFADTSLPEDWLLRRWSRLSDAAPASEARTEATQASAREAHAEAEDAERRAAGEAMNKAQAAMDQQGGTPSEEVADQTKRRSKSMDDSPDEHSANEVAAAVAAAEIKRASQVLDSRVELESEERESALAMPGGPGGDGWYAGDEHQPSDAAPKDEAPSHLDQIMMHSDKTTTDEKQAQAADDTNEPSRAQTLRAVPSLSHEPEIDPFPSIDTPLAGFRSPTLQVPMLHRPDSSESRDTVRLRSGEPRDAHSDAATVAPDAPPAMETPQLLKPEELAALVPPGGVEGPWSVFVAPLRLVPLTYLPGRLRLADRTHLIDSPVSRRSSLPTDTFGDLVPIISDRPSESPEAAADRAQPASPPEKASNPFFHSREHGLSTPSQRLARAVTLERVRKDSMVHSDSVTYEEAVSHQSSSNVATPAGAQSRVLGDTSLDTVVANAEHRPPRPTDEPQAEARAHDSFHARSASHSRNASAASKAEDPPWVTAMLRVPSEEASVQPSPTLGWAANDQVSPLKLNAASAPQSPPASPPLPMLGSPAQHSHSPRTPRADNWSSPTQSPVRDYRHVPLVHMDLSSASPPGKQGTASQMASPQNAEAPRRMYAGMLPQPSMVPPFELQNRSLVLPPGADPRRPGASGVCVECMMRDEDMADVIVTDPAVWERESDTDFHEAVRAGRISLGDPIRVISLKEHTATERMSSAARSKTLEMFVKQQQRLAAGLDAPTPNVAAAANDASLMPDKAVTELPAAPPTASRAAPPAASISARSAAAVEPRRGGAAATNPRTGTPLPIAAPALGVPLPEGYPAGAAPSILAAASLSSAQTLRVVDNARGADSAYVGGAREPSTPNSRVQATPPRFYAGPGATPPRFHAQPTPSTPSMHDIVGRRALQRTAATGMPSPVQPPSGFTSQASLVPSNTSLVDMHVAVDDSTHARPQSTAGPAAATPPAATAATAASASLAPLMPGSPSTTDASPDTSLDEARRRQSIKGILRKVVPGTESRHRKSRSTAAATVNGPDVSLTEVEDDQRSFWRRLGKTSRSPSFHNLRRVASGQRHAKPQSNAPEVPPLLQQYQEAASPAHAKT